MDETYAMDADSWPTLYKKYDESCMNRHPLKTISNTMFWYHDIIQKHIVENIWSEVRSYWLSSGAGR